MRNIRFNYAFVGMMGVCFLIAFLLPEGRTEGLRGHLQGLVGWVSRPVFKVAGGVADRVGKKSEGDGRSIEAVRAENDALRVALMNMEGQLAAMKELEGERSLVGPMRKMAVPVGVTGGDTGMRDSLSLSGTSRDGMKEGEAVLYQGGVVGKIERAGVTGSQVRLITDVESRVLATFGRYRRVGERLEFLQLAMGPQVVRGMGAGEMGVVNLTEKVVKDAGLAVGDWAIVADKDWPMGVQGYRVGHVVEIKAAKAAMFLDVKIEAEANLMGLREVMVVVR